MQIGITDTVRPKQDFEQYAAWVHRLEPLTEIVRLSHDLRNFHEVTGVDGLILTGGGDVHPSLYGREEMSDRVEDIDQSRDQFEMEVIGQALENETPILGICRGMQVVNIYLGGTLHIDLVSAGFRDHTQHNGTENRHIVRAVPHSLFEAIAGRGDHEINSLHHQAPEKLGRGLMISAVSGDGVIEAAEWILKDRMPFLLLVQWHPELMNGAHACSRNIGEYFLGEVKRFALNKQS